jgi:hypothetical protein
MFILACLLVSSFTVRGDTLYVEGPQVVVIDDKVEVIKPSWDIIHKPEVEIYADTLRWYFPEEGYWWDGKWQNGQYKLTPLSQ